MSKLQERRAPEPVFVTLTLTLDNISLGSQEVKCAKEAFQELTAALKGSGDIPVKDYTFGSIRLVNVALMDVQFTVENVNLFIRPELIRGRLIVRYSHLEPV